MIAALYGELVPHAWLDPELELDAYALFYNRSIAMGWHDDRSAGGGVEDRMIRAPGLWSMNDAGWNHPLAAAGAGLISWFQVEASPVADDRPLPVQPFLRCAEDATAQAGVLNLSAVQILLPVQVLDPLTRAPYAPTPAMQTKEWFAQCAQDGRIDVEVNINSGRDRPVPAVAHKLANLISHLDQDVFDYRSHGVVSQDAAVSSPFDDRLWNGPPLHGMVLHGELAQWSCDAVGWLAELAADAVAQLGVRRPLMLTVTRSPQPF